MAKKKRNGRKTADILPEAGYESLAQAIILQAIEDYETAIARAKERPEVNNAEQTEAECEGFFRSAWCELLLQGINRSGFRRNVERRRLKAQGERLKTEKANIGSKNTYLILKNKDTKGKVAQVIITGKQRAHILEYLRKENKKALINYIEEVMDSDFNPTELL